MKFNQVFNQFPTGTSYSGIFTATLRTLQAFFGDGLGDEGDGKVVHQWIFRGANGRIVTLYDWKYVPGEHEQYEWHIGSIGQQECIDFKEWLMSELFAAEDDEDEFRTGEKKGQAGGPQPKYSGPLKIVTKKTTYKEMRDEYLRLMDEERVISQKWKLRKIGRTEARAQIQKIWDKRNAIMDRIDETAEKGRA